MTVMQDWYERRTVWFELGDSAFEADIQITWGQDSFSHAFGVEVMPPHVEDVEIYDVVNIITGRSVPITQAMKDIVNCEVQP